MPRLSKIGAAALAAFGWTSGVSAVSASYLVVAGGGGGGAAGAGGGGGGGAGGFRTGTLSLTPASSYTVTVGAGGAGGTTGQSGATGDGTSGSDSILSTITSTGGGGGGAGGLARAGKTGGSGGGGGHNGGAGGAGNTPSTTPSQGNNGGTPNAAHNGGGGGGGASAVGATTPSAAVGGAGGAGTASSISGSSVTYAGGGGGSSNTTGGAGGAGGGGAGGIGGGASGTAGTANLGGGGGGGYGSTGVAAAGGSGIVIISYAGAQQFGGGVVTSVGGNTIHTFTTSGTLVPVTPLSASYLVVAGGGAGARHSGAGAGGGGAGGLLSGSGLAIDSNSTYLVTVGAGGTIAADFAAGGDGTNSTFSMVTTSAVGGGGGGAQNSNGRSGGSGGGGTYLNGTGGAGTSGQGNNGGSNTSGNSGGGGGGGAGAVGSNSSGSNGGNGGNGTASSITGSSVTYAGGGGGGTNGATPGSGGTGGGGTGANASGGNATAGTANLGGGGGGAGYLGGTAGNGGSGVVIISYPGSTQQMAGGTVTITGGNVIHTFTSSGYLTPLKLVNNSLRFRSSASAYLNRTPATAGNRRTWTWSGWVKRGRLSVTNYLFSAPSTSSSSIFFSGVDRFHVTGASGAQFNLETTSVYRDISAWYHIVVALDTTQATSTDRLKIYVNGNQLTAFASATYPSLNLDGEINNNIFHQIGRPDANTHDGYLTEINFIDGQALTPNSFGTFNSYGVWQPITYGGSYGTNGFYLPFTNKTSTTTLGYDFSPNGNNWTTNNISLTAGATYDSMTDVPTLTSATAANYAVLNPLSTLYTVTAGNLDFTYTNSTSGVWYLKGTLAVSSDKYYWEVTPTNVGAGLNISIGIILSTNTQTNTTTINLVTDGYVYHSDGNKYSGAGGTTGVAYGATYTNNDVIGVALDLTAGTLVFYKNNVSQGTAFTGLTSSYMLLICNHLGGTSRTVAGSVNAGQRPFTYTPPTGFVALNTYNL